MSQARGLISGFCFNPATVSTQNLKKTLSSASPVTYSFQSCKPISLNHQLSLRMRSSKHHIIRAQTAALNDEVAEPAIKRKKLAVFVSGGGSNFKSIHEACLQGLVHGDVVALVTNKNDCGGAHYARNHGIPILLFPKVMDSTDGLSPNELVHSLRGFGIDFILLAGYLKLIPVELVRAYPKCILNIHPSLLPAFGGKGYYGMKVHKAVLASGARYSGPTIHFVDEHYDTGKILAQRAVPVSATDTAQILAAKVLNEEHNLYVEVVAAICENRIQWREDGVPLIQSQQNPTEYY